MRLRLTLALAAAALAGLAGTPAQAATKKKPKQVVATFQGVIKSVSPSTGRVTISVTGGNVYGRKLVKKTASFDVRTARISIGDANQDGKANIADAAVGHLGSATAKVPQTGKWPRRLKALQFVDLRALVVLPPTPALPIEPQQPPTIG